MSLSFRPALDGLGREMFVIKYQRCPIGAIMQRGWAQDWYVLLNRRIVAVAPTFDTAKVIAQHEFARRCDGWVPEATADVLEMEREALGFIPGGFSLESEWQREAGQ